MKGTRRDFIEWAAFSGALWAASPFVPCLNAWANYKLDFDAFIVSDGPTPVSDPSWRNFTQGDLLAAPSEGSVWDLKFNRIKNFNLSFMAHKFQQNPARLTQVIAAGKRLRKLAALDLAKGTVRELPAPNGVTFFGHGFFEQKGQFYFATAFDHVRGFGVLLKYATENLNHVGTIPSHGLYPHDVQIVSELDPNFCVVLNVGAFKGAKPRYPWDRNTNYNCSAAVIDFTNGRLIRNITISDLSAGLAHFVKVGDSKIFAVGSGPAGGKTEPPSAVLINIETGAVENYQSVTNLSGLQGEANNPIFIPERNSVVVSSYTTYDLFEIGIREKKILNRIAIADVAAHFYLGSGRLLLTRNRAGSSMQELQLFKGYTEIPVADSLGHPAKVNKGSGSHFSPILRV